MVSLCRLRLHQKSVGDPQCGLQEVPETFEFYLRDVSRLDEDGSGSIASAVVAQHPITASRSLPSRRLSGEPSVPVVLVCTCEIWYSMCIYKGNFSFKISFK